MLGSTVRRALPLLPLPTLAVTYEAAPAPKGWRFVLRLEIPPG